MGYKVVNVENNNKASGTAVGVGYPFNKTAVFGKTFTTIDKAATNLKCLLLTRKGERYIQPEFGTDLLFLIFEPNVGELKDEIITTISEPVEYWLPYIILTELIVTTLDDDPTMLHNVKVTIGFTVAGLIDNSKITIFADENGILQVE